MPIFVSEHHCVQCDDVVDVYGDITWFAVEAAAGRSATTSFEIVLMSCVICRSFCGVGAP